MEYSSADVALIPQLIEVLRSQNAFEFLPQIINGGSPLMSPCMIDAGLIAVIVCVSVTLDTR